VSGLIEKVVIAAVGLLISWATWLTTRSLNSLSRSEHERLCTERQVAVDKQLARLEEKQDRIHDLLISVIREHNK
jgi:hypothetical protein